MQFYLDETFTGSFFTTQMFLEMPFGQNIFLPGIATPVSDTITLSPRGFSRKKADCQTVQRLGPHLLQASGQRGSVKAYSEQITMSCEIQGREICKGGGAAKTSPS